MMRKGQATWDKITLRDGIFKNCREERNEKKILKCGPDDCHM
jgi:hypothetical protein